MMFAMVLPLPRTSSSFGAGFPPCFLWHTSSAFMSSGWRVGTFPSKITVPVMDEAATATRGQTDTVTSTAASHNLFPVPRMLGSLVIVYLGFASQRPRLPTSKRSVGAGIFSFPRILHRTCHPSTADPHPHRFHFFSGQFSGDALDCAAAHISTAPVRLAPQSRVTAT